MIDHLRENLECQGLTCEVVKTGRNEMCLLVTADLEVLVKQVMRTVITECCLLSFILPLSLSLANTHAHTHTHTHTHTRTHTHTHTHTLTHTHTHTHTLTHTHTQAESQEWTKEIRDSEEVANITFADMENFKCSEESHFFTSGEEIRLLLHTIQNTPYDTVSVDACTVCSTMCILSMAKYRILRWIIITGACGTI